MKTNTILLIFSSLLIISCNDVSDKTKKTLNEGGKTVGKTATEFIEGVTKGVQSTLECDIVLSEDLKNKGLQTGTFEITNSSDSTQNNMLTLYLIFDKDIKTTVTAKAFNKNEKEIGRSSLDISGKAGDAEYFDFVFNKRTEIGVRSQILIQEKN